MVAVPRWRAEVDEGRPASRRNADRRVPLMSFLEPRWRLHARLAHALRRGLEGRVIRDTGDRKAAHRIVATALDTPAVLSDYHLDRALALIRRYRLSVRPAATRTSSR